MNVRWLACWLSGTVVAACSLFAPNEADLSGGHGSGGASGLGGSGHAGAAGEGGSSGGPGGSAAAGGGSSGAAGASGGAGAGGMPSAPCDCARVHAIGECVEEQCVFTECAPGWVDENELLGDGCERPDVPQGSLLLWLSADSGVSADAAGRVSSWRDRGPSAVDVTAPSDAARPTLVTTPRGPMLQFDGSSALAISPLPAFTTVSLFIVAEVEEESACSTLVHFSNRTGDVPTDDVDLMRHHGALDYQVGGVYLDAQNSIELGRAYVMSATHRFDGELASVFRDGGNVGDGAIPLPSDVVREFGFIGSQHRTLAPADDGHCGPLAGRVAEVLVFAPFLLYADRVRVHDYLLSKWQITPAD